MQTKISRDAEKSQKESHRAHMDRARVETSVEQQLVRVLAQMQRFVEDMFTP